MDLEELPDSRERTGALVLWLPCEGQADVQEMFSDNSCLSAILERQGLLVAAPTDLRMKKADNFAPQLLQGFWLELKKKSQDRCDVPNCHYAKPQQKEVALPTFCACLSWCP